MEVLAFYGIPVEVKPPLTKIALPIDAIRVGRRGAIYELRMDVEGLTPQNVGKALDMLIKGMKEEFGITTLHAKASETQIIMQIRGSPFAWAALIAWLPIILSLVGIVLIGISIWQIMAAMPAWVWILLIVGGGLILLGPGIGELVLAEAEKVKPRG
jgi:hypothetical protein